MTTNASLDATTHAAGELADAVQDVLRQLIDKVIGGPSKDKEGRPLRDVCYMQLPVTEPIDPRDYSDAWDPAGAASSADVQDDGKLGAAAVQQATKDGKPVADKQLQHSIASRRKTAWKFDRMLRITDDGSYRPFTSAGTLSSSYEAIITKAQGIPAPPPPPDIQKQIDDAMHILYVFDDSGKQKGKTKEFKNYQNLKQAYADAETDFANAHAAAMADATLGSVWPVTSKSYQAKVDNAYDDWRSAGAEKIENALETVKAQGGSIGNHFLAQARSLYDAWSLGLSGSVAAQTPYTEIQPGSWYDPNDKENGFTDIEASASQFQSASASQSASAVSSWWKGQTSSTGGGAAGMIFGITFGATASHSESDQHSETTWTGGTHTSFSNSMSNVKIKLSYGLCDIYRPWLLKELFVIDGWYLPGEKDKVVSDGTIGGQKGDDDSHLLPMIPTQFLVVRNVTIEADGWGSAGDMMSQYCRDHKDDSHSSSTSVQGGVGFMGFGGEVSHSNADWSGDDSDSAKAAGSWFFESKGAHGKLTINGCALAAFIGEIMPLSPKVDGTKKVDSTKKTGATT